MSRRIHIPGLSARPRYARDTRTTPGYPRTGAPSVPAAASSPSSVEGFSVRLAGLKHEFRAQEFATIAMNAARVAADQEIELDMEGLLEAARDFRGESDHTPEPAAEPVQEEPVVQDPPSEMIQDAPLDMEDVVIQPPTSREVLGED